MRSLIRPMLLTWLAGAAQAQGICDQTGAALGSHITGQWQLEVVHSTVISGDVTQEAPAGASEAVTIGLGPSGKGGIQIKEAILPLSNRSGVQGDSISDFPEHMAAYEIAAATLTVAETAPCPLPRRPQLSARKVTTDEFGDTVNTIELTLMGHGLLAGAQVVDIPPGRMGRRAPSVRIVAAIVLRQTSKGLPE